MVPEQERALAYARKRGTEAPLDEIRGRVASTYADFEALVDGIQPEVARERREASGWSVQEVVDHLVESDGRAARQLAGLLAGRDDDEPIPAGLQSERPLDLDWAALRERFRAVHQEVLALLAGAADDGPLAARAAVQMVVKHAGPDGALRPVHWVARFDWKAYAVLLHAHNREHIAQVQRILGAP